MDLFSKIRLLSVFLLAFSSIAFTQAEGVSGATQNSSASCAPPNYGCARSDLIKTNNLNPAPDMSQGKNTIVTPSDFKLPIVRVTDGKTFINRSMTVTISGSNGDNIFNTNDTYLLVNDGYGWRYPVSFNPSTMQVLNTSPWQPGTNQVRWAGPASFSRTSPNVLFIVPAGPTPIAGVNATGTKLYKVTLSGTTSISGSGTAVYDFGKCPGMPSPYDIGNGIWRSAFTVSAGDKRFAQAFSNKAGGQNTGTDITVYDAPSGQCYRYDTAHARLCTSAGCAPMSSSDEFTVHEVYMSLDGNYLRIEFGHCVKGACFEGSEPYLWQIGTTNVTHCYNSSHSPNCTGHMVEGYTHLYSSLGWPTTLKRKFSDPLTYSVVNTSPALSPHTETHFSNNAADPYDTNPYWATNVQNVRTKFGGAGCNSSGNLYEGCTFPGPLYGEIFGITQSGGYIRAAHSYNSGSSSYFNCANTIGAVSQTGKFFAWTSDWLTTLGKDANNQNRCDVFIVNVAAAQGAAQ